MAYIGQKEMAAAAASVGAVERLPRMVVSTEGLEGSGKTRWALEGTPRPLTFLDWDWGFEGQPPELMQGVTRYTFDALGATFGQTEEEGKRRTALEVQRFVKEFRAAVEAKVRTLVVDTFTAAWAAQRLARADDKYVEMEEEFKALVRMAYVSPHTNLILIHHLKKDWARSRDGKSYPSGTYSRDGMDGIATMVQLAIRQRYTPKSSNGPAKFEIDVLKCRDNIDIVGSTYPSMTFPELCGLVAPAIDWSK